MPRNWLVWSLQSCMCFALFQFGVAHAADSLVAELERANSSSERLDKALIAQAADQAILREKSIDGLVSHFSKLAADAASTDRARANSFLTIAHLQWQHGRMDDALIAVEEALSISQSIDALMSKARLLDAQGMEQEADEWYAKAEQRIAVPEELEFIAIRRAMIDADEDNIQSLLSLAETRDQAFKNRAAVAIALLDHPDKAIVMYRPDSESEHYYRQLVRMTEWALAAQEHDLAKETSWRAYDAATALANRFYALALVVETYRRSESLPDLLPLAAERAETDPDMRRLQVDVFAETELYDEAIEQYQSLPAGAGNATTRQELISLYEAAGRTEDMVAEYERMIASEPSQVLWYYGLARHYVNEAQSDQAKEIWQQFAANNQANAEILVSGADYMLKMGFADAASDMLSAHSTAYGPSAAVFLFSFNNHFDHGDFEHAQDVIQDFESNLDPASPDMYFVADAYERLRKYDFAIEVYKKLQTHREKLSYDNRMRLAWLYSVADQKEKALEEWQSIWLDVVSPARRSFAESQLLLISAELAMIADIVIELEEKLFKRTADRNEINLLVRIYTEIGDDFSATEVVEEYSRYGDMDEITKLKQLGNVYLQLFEYEKYDEVLKKLEQIDPDNRIEHIQNIVLNLLAHDLATEKSEKYDEIQRWLGELRAFDREAVSGEFEASIFSMGGFEEDAIDSYRRALIEQPQHSDNLLLMADLMKNLNRVDEAVSLLQYVAEHAEDDNEFVVAVDGIINMIGQRTFGEELSEEHQAIFRWAHRIILERITSRDEKFYLYTLLSEIANETNNREAEYRAIENSLPAAGLRRAAILRELMTMSTPDAGFTFERNEGDPERQLRYGRRLIGLRQELPPDVFISIGRTLLSQGDTHNAKKSFEMINDITGMTDVNKTTADLFFEEGFDDSAIAFYAEALATDQSNIELLLKVALLREFRGQFDVANNLYLNALRLLLKRQPAVLANMPESSAPPAQLIVVAPSSVDTSVTREYRQYYESLAHGFLMTWPEERTRSESVVSDLKALLDEELVRVAASFSTDEQISYARYSRLNRIQQFLTRVARATSTQELAIYVQTAIAKHFEEDEKVGELEERQREFWGGKEIAEDVPERTAEVSRLQFRLDDAMAKGDLAETIQLARLLGKEELIYSELLKRINDGEVASAVRFGQHSLRDTQYRQLMAVAVARLEDQQPELLSFIDNEPSMAREIERVVGHPLISADDLLFAIQTKRQDVQADQTQVFLFSTTNGVWSYLGWHGNTAHKLNFLEHTIESIGGNERESMIAELQVSNFFDDLLRLDLTEEEQERLFALVQDYISKLDLKEEWRVERAAFSLVLKLDSSYSANGELIVRLAENWHERTQQDYSEIVDAFYTGKKSEALDHCLDMIASGRIGQSQIRFLDLVGVAFSKEIARELDEIVNKPATRASLTRLRTLYRLHTSVSRTYDGSYQANSHGHLPTSDLEKFVQHFPDDDEFAVVLILGLLRDGRAIDAENKMRSYYESHPDDKMMRAAYYLQLIENERFVMALQLVRDGGENLADAETLDSLAEGASEAFGGSAFNSAHVFLHLRPPELRRFSNMDGKKRLDKAVSELRTSVDPQVIAINLRKLWRGSLVAHATAERYGIGGDFSAMIYQYVSSLPFDPATKTELGPYLMGSSPTFESILDEADNRDTQTLFQHLAGRVASGDEVEKYMRVQKNANRKISEKFYFDLVDFYAPHTDSLRERLADLTRKLDDGVIGDHEFTLWMLLWNRSGENPSSSSFEKARARFDAILKPTRLQTMQFAEVADSVGEFDLANELYRLFAANATRSMHLETVYGYDDDDSIPLNLAVLVDQITEFGDLTDRDELLDQVLIVAARIDATSVTRALHDAFVLRSLSKSVEGAELLDSAKRFGISLSLGEEAEVNQYLVPKAVELVRARATAGEFEQAMEIVRTLLTIDDSRESRRRFSAYPTSDQEREEARSAASLNSFYDLNMHLPLYGGEVPTIRQQFLSQRTRLVEGLSEQWYAYLVDALIEWMRETDTIEEDFLDCMMALLLEIGMQGRTEQLNVALNEIGNTISLSDHEDRLKLQVRLIELMLALDIPPDEKQITDLVAEGLLNSEQRHRLLQVHIKHRDAVEISRIAEILDRGDGNLNLLRELQKIADVSQDTKRPDDISERIANLESAKEALML